MPMAREDPDRDAISVSTRVMQWNSRQFRPAPARHLRLARTGESFPRTELATREFQSFIENAQFNQVLEIDDEPTGAAVYGFERLRFPSCEDFDGPRDREFANPSVNVSRQEIAARSEANQGQGCPILTGRIAQPARLRTGLVAERPIACQRNDSRDGDWKVPADRWLGSHTDSATHYRRRTPPALPGGAGSFPGSGPERGCAVVEAERLAVAPRPVSFTTEGPALLGGSCLSA